MNMEVYEWVSSCAPGSFGEGLLKKHGLKLTVLKYYQNISPGAVFTGVMNISLAKLRKK
jgi:hypothetical protein